MIDTPDTPVSDWLLESGAGLAPMQSRPYHDAERGYVDPITEDPQSVRSFMSSLWRACERAESPDTQPKDTSPA